MNLLLLLGILNLSLLYLCEGGATPAEQQEIVDMHNKYRRALAAGQISGQPQAADMLEMKWNSNSASLAQRSSDKCVFGHDQTKDRLYGGYKWVGQNIALFSGRNISQGVKMWFEEVKSFTYEGNSCSEVCGHYTQVSWAKSAEIGCGISQCKYNGWDVTFLYCNYGPGGNFNNALPYQVGEACSKCPINTKCVDSLCR